MLFLDTVQDNYENSKYRLIYGQMNRPLGTTDEALLYFIELQENLKGKSLSLYHKVYGSFRFSHNLKTWGLAEYK